MTKVAGSGPIEGYFTKDGKLHTWPSRKRSDLRIEILRWFADQFEADRTLTEREVNEILKSKAILDDYVLLRRELVDGGFLARTPDGRAYWRLAEHSAKPECSG